MNNRTTRRNRNTTHEESRRELLRNKFKYIWFFPNNLSRFNSAKEILEQRTKRQITEDIITTCTRLIARLQPTNNHKIGAIVILLQAISDLAPSIETPSGEIFNYNSKKIQNLYIRKLDILQAQLGSIHDNIFEPIPLHLLQTIQQVPLLPGKLSTISHNIIQALQNVYFEEGANLTIHEDEEILASLSKQGARKHIKDQGIKNLITKRTEELINEINNLKLEEELEEIEENKGHRKYKTNEKVEAD